MPETLHNCIVFLAMYKALSLVQLKKPNNRSTELHTEKLLNALLDMFLLTCSSWFLKYNRYSQETINFRQHTRLATQLK